MRGDAVLTFENVGNRWLIWLRWECRREVDKQGHYVTACLGDAPTIEGAKEIAGLFGAATANAVYQVAKDADKLREVETGVYNAAGVADLFEVQSAYARAEYDARQSVKHMERLTQEGAAYEALRAGEIDYRGGRVRMDSAFTGNCPDCSRPLPANIGECVTGACAKRPEDEERAAEKDI